MIEFIRGEMDFISPEYIVVEVNGIGYQLFCPNPYVFQPMHGKVVKIYTYHYVREDVDALYGFKTREEKALFTKLLQVSGIGPKGALAILAVGQHDQVVQAIEEEDDKFLTKFPGVGKKTARQMILDLKGKLQDLELDIAKENPGVVKGNRSVSKELEEAIEALKVLGYANKEIDKIAPILSNEQLSTDQYIRQALQMLLKR